MNNREKLIKLIAKLISDNESDFFDIGGDTIKVTNNGTSIEVLFDAGDSDIVITSSNQILR